MFIFHNRVLKTSLELLFVSVDEFIETAVRKIFTLLNQYVNKLSILSQKRKTVHMSNTDTMITVNLEGGEWKGLVPEMY